MRSRFKFSKSLIAAAVFLTAAFGFSGSAQAGVIFEDNFDSQPNWSPQSYDESCTSAGCKNSVPGNWDYYRTAERWHPISQNNSSYHPTIQISDENYYGASGKGYTQWNEANIGPIGGGADGWGADGILAKDLGNDYNEIYVQVKLKFQPGFNWYYYVNNGAAVKQLRFYHWDRTGGVFSFGTGNYNSPTYVFDSSHNPWGFRHNQALRCTPASTYNEYQCIPPGYTQSYNYTGNPTFGNSLGDNNWHTLEWHGKINSAPGIADGVIEFWHNGLLEYSRKDIEWVRAGNPLNYGWNIVGIGGNAHNMFNDTWYPTINYSVNDTVVYSSKTYKCLQSNINIKPENNPSYWQDLGYLSASEQWYAIDDVVVSTSYIPDNYAIGGGSSDIAPPAAPQGLTVQ